MDTTTIIILVATLVADLSIGGAAWLLAKRQGTLVDQLAEAVTALKTIAQSHTARIADHDERIGALERGDKE